MQHPLSLKSLRPGRLLSLLSSIVFLLFFSSCEKDPDLVGLEVTPAQDELGVTVADTFTIVAYSELDDSVITNYFTPNMAGSYFDPVFGRVTAGFFTHIRLPSVNPAFGNHPVLDSLVLVLPYNSYYGDTTTLQTFRVYEAADDFYIDTTYYSCTPVNTTGVLYGQHVFAPRPTDSVPYDTILIAPQFRINLSENTPALGDKILNAPAEYLSDLDKFQDYIKGLYVTAAPVSYGGCVLYFNLLSAYSRIELHYHNDEADSLYYELIVNEDCARFNHFDHGNYQYASPAFRRQVVFGDTTLGDQVLYLQSTGGVRTKLQFPTLKSWAKNKKIAINEAKLILPVLEDDPVYAPPSNLAAIKIDGDGTLSNLPDYGTLGDVYYGGAYDETTNQYYFRLTQHVQNILKPDYKDYGIYLKASRAAIRANRVLLSGPKSPTRPMKLRIIYSYIP